MELSPVDAADLNPVSLGAGVARGCAVAPEVLRVEKLRKEYVTGRGRLLLFEDLSFTITQGELIAIVGESGAGKSTLLHILGALDTATSGDIYFRSTLLRFSSPRQSADFRNREVGY